MKTLISKQLPVDGGSGEIYYRKQIDRKTYRTVYIHASYKKSLYTLCLMEERESKA